MTSTQQLQAPVRGHAAYRRNDERDQGGEVRLDLARGDQREQGDHR